MKGVYLRPRHPRGPMENGWLALRLSVADSSQRSGLKTKGSLKLDASRLEAIGFVDTIV